MQVEVLLDAVPLVRVQAAGGERVEGGAGRDGDIGDDCAGVVGGEGIVDVTG